MTNMYPPAAQMPAPQPPLPPKRSVPKVVLGIIMIVFGGLGLLGSLNTLPAMLNSQAGRVDAAYRLGAFIGVAIVAVILIVGIILVAKSKPKPKVM